MSSPLTFDLMGSVLGAILVLGLLGYLVFVLIHSDRT